MMLKPFCAAVGLFVVITAAPFKVKSQSILEKNVYDLVDAVPKPPASLMQAMEKFGRMPIDEVPPQFRQALDELNNMRYSILKPLYETLDKAAKQRTTGYGQEDQKLLRDVQTMSNAWGKDVMYGFVSRIEYSTGITKQFWTRPKQPLSANAQNYYGQLVQIEKDVGIPAFLQQAKEREGLVFHDSRLDDIDAERIRTLSEVPLKKIKFAEGSDVMIDLPDREKTIEVMKRYDARKMGVFKMVYHQQYTWWQTNYTRLAAAAKKLDVILLETHFGQNLSGNDRQIVPAIADVQARMIGMMYHLVNIGTKIISISQQASAAGQATEEYMKNMNVTSNF